MAAQNVTEETVAVPARIVPFGEYVRAHGLKTLIPMVSAYPEGDLEKQQLYPEFLCSVNYDDAKPLTRSNDPYDSGWDVSFYEVAKRVVYYDRVHNFDYESASKIPAKAVESNSVGQRLVEEESPRARSVTLFPGDRVMIDTGVSVSVPPGFEVQARPRSGRAWKEGVTVLNSPGTIDCSYTGPVCVILINHSRAPVTYKHGDLIAQLVIAPVAIIGSWKVVKGLSGTDRGEKGFGSTESSLTVLNSVRKVAVEAVEEVPESIQWDGWVGELRATVLGHLLTTPLNNIFGALSSGEYLENHEDLRVIVEEHLLDPSREYWGDMPKREALVDSLHSLSTATFFATCSSNLLALAVSTTGGGGPAVADMTKWHQTLIR